jgi:hypothetical protein
MSSFPWEQFLTEWSGELLQFGDTWDLEDEVIALGWLGYAGATEAQIKTAEQRLGTALPPSYRKFLQASNGWRTTGPFIDRMWSTEQIEWFCVRHQQWIDAYVEVDDAPPLSDAEYFVYGEKQYSAYFRTEYLQTALEISDEGDSAIYLLNPGIVTPEGEWEAWRFANWLPGAQRYRSFQEMMLAEREIFLRLKGTKKALVEYVRLWLRQ